MKHEEMSTAAVNHPSCMARSESVNHLRGNVTVSFTGVEGEEHDPTGRNLVLILSIAKDNFQFACNVNTVTGRPYQDCIDLIAAYCTDIEYTLE